MVGWVDVDLTFQQTISDFGVHRCQELRLAEKLRNEHRNPVSVPVYKLDSPTDFSTCSSETCSVKHGNIIAAYIISASKHEVNLGDKF